MADRWRVKLPYKPRSNFIYSKNYRVNCGGKIMSLFETEKAGLVEIFRDPYFDAYSYIIKATSEVSSFWFGFHEKDWPEWLKQHVEKPEAARSKA